MAQSLRLFSSSSPIFVYSFSSTTDKDSVNIVKKKMSTMMALNKISGRLNGVLKLRKATGEPFCGEIKSVVSNSSSSDSSDDDEITSDVLSSVFGNTDSDLVIDSDILNDIDTHESSPSQGNNLLSPPRITRVKSSPQRNRPSPLSQLRNDASSRSSLRKKQSSWDLLSIDSPIPEDSNEVSLATSVQFHKPGLPIAVRFTPPIVQSPRDYFIQENKDIRTKTLEKHWQYLTPTAKLPYVNQFFEENQLVLKIYSELQKQGFAFEQFTNISH